MNRTLIPADSLHETLASAANATTKGPAQFFTPLEIARALSPTLPDECPHIADFTCGSGNLFAAGHRPGGGQSFYGIDLDRRMPKPPRILAGQIHKITADLTRIFPLLRETQWQCSTAVLNPPWGLHWPRERLATLAASERESVARSFAMSDPVAGADQIDSTLATWLIAMEFLHDRGDGLLIANAATIERLVPLHHEKPNHPLAAHVWAYVTLAGNPMTGESHDAWRGDAPFRTAFIWFAPGHESGIKFRAHCPDLFAFHEICARLKARRMDWREGPEFSPYSIGIHSNNDTRWRAAHEEWKAHTRPERSDFNLWLKPDGSIGAYLSLFDQVEPSRRLQSEADQLLDLAGRQPGELVVQRAERDWILRVLKNDSTRHPWRVEPRLREAVQQALAAYHAARAPLYPLPDIQRLGYLEEEDAIVCREDLKEASQEPVPIASRKRRKNSPARTLFAAGQSYPLRTTSVQVTRRGVKRNLQGELDEIVYSGQELAFHITDAEGTERVFMEARLRDPGITLTAAHSRASRRRGPAVPLVMDFTLGDLARHFTIPQVPDVAQTQAGAFQNALSALDALENQMETRPAA